jgi:hypothetical protein
MIAQKEKEFSTTWKETKSKGCGIMGFWSRLTLEFEEFITFHFILTVSNPYKYHSFSFIFHLASSLALKGGDSTERGVGLGGGKSLLHIY